MLAKAKKMGMKIWAMEKLARILATIFETEDDATTFAQRARSAATGISNPNKYPALSQMLKDEQLNGPSDRDPTVADKDIIRFKGPFIYVHDMNEKTRPVMVRDYDKVAKREDGAWPQFRSVSSGRCPFVEETLTKKDLERIRAREKEEQIQRERAKHAPRTRSVTAGENANMQPPNISTRSRALMEVENGQNRSIAPPKPSEPSKLIPAKRSSPEKAVTVFRNAAVGRPPRMYGGEPVASGVQPSNITSAIRSQMISSTAAQPGAKAGTSKEVHELKRKVLEKNSGSLSTGGIPSSHRMTDLAAVLKNERQGPAARLAKQRAQAKLGGIDEDCGGEDRKKVTAGKKAAPLKKERSRDPKPGYCENCREKFDDFEDVRFPLCSFLELLLTQYSLSSISRPASTASSP